MYKAYVYEYERGWGARLEDTKTFDTIEERDNFILKFNSENIKELHAGEPVPEVYWRAES